MIPFLQRVGFPHEQEEGEHQWIPKKAGSVPPLPITGTSVSCPCHWFWVAPELGVVFVRFLLCPALFSECRRGCRPGSCTPPPRYIHSVWSHCSAPKNLGNKGKKRGSQLRQDPFGFWNCSRETSTGEKAPLAFPPTWKMFLIFFFFWCFRNIKSSFHQPQKLS